MDFPSQHTRPTTGSPIAGCFAHLRALPPGDKLIALVLAGALGILLIAGLYALERQFLVEVPAYGGSLVEGSVGAPRFVNPLLAISDADRALAALTFAGLMGYDAEGRLVPVLAESYEVSEDGTAYTFRLRENLRFSDGKPLTSEDVAFTVARARDPQLRSPRAADFANVAVEAVDARTVRFALREAEPSFPASLTLGILPAHVWRAVSSEQFPFAPQMIEPVGAGPFKVARVARGKDGSVARYGLERFDGYALGKPYLARITFVYFADTEALREAVARGRVESAFGVPGEHALRVPYSRVFGVFFNQGENAAFMRAEVRRALSVALERDRIVAEALGGYALPVFGPVPPSLLTEGRASDPAGGEDRLAEARRILTAGGWTFDEEAGVWKHESAGTLAFTLSTGNAPELRALAEELRKEWQALSVPVALEFSSANDLMLRSIRPREYEALLYGMVIGKSEDLYAFWHSSQRNDPGLNIARYTNRSVDDLLERLRGNPDETERQTLLSRLDAAIAAEYPAAFTHAPEFLYALPRDLRGVVLGAVSAPADRFLTAAFWYRDTELVWPAFANDR